MNMIRKRLLSLVLVLCLLTPLCSQAGNNFDMSVIRNNEYLTIDVDAENEVAFIESVLDTQDRSFVHSRESEYLYSDTKFDLLIHNYFSNNAYPVMRLWISLSTDDMFYYITSATFSIGDKDYTFSEIADTKWFTTGENGMTQKVLIKFGIDNIDFLIALEEVVSADEFDIYNTYIPLVLHGTEDITTQLDAGFLADFIVLISTFVECNGIEFIDQLDGTTMKVKQSVK